MSYADAAQVRREVAQIVRPPRRMRVSDAALKHVRVSGAGVASPWAAELTPYMIEPMDCLSSRRYHTVCFVGPARTGKTFALLDAWIGYVVKCDPGDMMIVHTSQDQARDYSRRRVDRLFRNSPDLKNEIAPGGSSDNTYDKLMRNGMILSIGWPTVSQLASKDIKYIALTDYDRGQEDVGGEGDKYSLAQKRTETFMSAGKTMLESSPGGEWLDIKWQKRGLHELPPSPGIVSVYNRGDRRWWYWECRDCKKWFSPVFDLLQYDAKLEPYKAASGVRCACPHCGVLFEHRHKRELNKHGRWIGETQSKIASFWMSGVAAAYQTWESLVYKRLTSLLELEQTGSDESLRGTVLMDEGVPYLSPLRKSTRSSNSLLQRAEPVQKRAVPEGVRFLVTSVDVQKARFVIQVHGYGINKERWIIDRYNIKRSAREDQNGDPLPIDPAAYLEDWLMLVDVIKKTYPLADESGRHMPSRLTGCDSGGAAGVTDKAYEFYRRLRHIKDGTRLAKAFHLIKGTDKGARVSVTYPDSRNRSDRKARSAGDVPVLLVNTQIIKDALAGDLARDEPGAGYIHMPSWLGNWWFDELSNEERDTVKGWQGRGRNEAWDLLVYADALAIHAGIEAINWESPPAWAREWDKNTSLFDPTRPPINTHTPKPKPQHSAGGGAGSWF